MSDNNLIALYRQDRAKSMTEPWSDSEHRAVFELGIPPDMVRKGILTLEDLAAATADVESVEAEGGVPLIKMSYPELAHLAGKVGALFRDGMEHGSLISSIRLAQESPESDEKVREEVPVEPEEPEDVSVPEQACSECGFVAKSAAGLAAHSRRHASLEGGER